MVRLGGASRCCKDEGSGSWRREDEGSPRRDHEGSPCCDHEGSPRFLGEFTDGRECEGLLQFHRAFGGMTTSAIMKRAGRGTGAGLVEGRCDGRLRGKMMGRDDQ